MDTPPSTHSRFKALYAIASLVLAGVLLFYSLRGIEWGRVVRIVSSANLSYVAMAASLNLISLFLRAVRWRVLLSAEGEVSVSTAFWATSAGYFGNNFLPARAGELVRTFMISSRVGLSRTYVLTTALAERVADAIALVSISSLVLLTLKDPPSWLKVSARPFAILGLCGVLGIVVTPYLEPLLLRLLRRIGLSTTFQDRIQNVLEQSVRGIRSFHDRGRLARFLGLTGVIWLNDAFCTVVGVQALGLSVSLPVAFLLIAGLGLGSALPSTPGYVGIYQFVAISILTPFGFSRTDAIAYILFLQAMQYVIISVCGLVGIAQYRRMKAELASAPAAATEL